MAISHADLGSAQAFAFLRSLVIPIIYIGAKVQTLIPLLVCIRPKSCADLFARLIVISQAIAVLSTALMGVKIALLATLGKGRT